jgi:hypothetical protein
MGTKQRSSIQEHSARSTQRKSGNFASYLNGETAQYAEVVFSVCPEREQLLLFASQLLGNHTKLVAELVNWTAVAGRSEETHQEFCRLSDEVKASAQAVKAAWGEYQAHVRLHDCSLKVTADLLLKKSIPLADPAL